MALPSSTIDWRMKDGVRDPFKESPGRKRGWAPKRTATWMSPLEVRTWFVQMDVNGVLHLLQKWGILGL